MTSQIRTKIRALIEDLAKNGFEVFEYNNSVIFTLQEEHISTINSVLQNGVELGSGEYSYNSSTNKIEILITGLANGDNIEIDYTYYKYSDSELDEYIKGALIWMSIYGYSETDYEIENGDIFPTPDNRTLDLLCIVCAILIKPNYSSYNLPNVRVIYPRKSSKEEKIEKIVKRFNMGLGIMDVIQFDEYNRRKPC